MSILLLGLNHRTAPVEVRERLAFSRQGIATALMLFRRQFPDCEAAILSTCNRVEFLFADGSEGNASAGIEERLVQFLAQVRNVPAVVFRPHLYRVDGAAVVRHVFRVISGLDSMVVGECQIVNQLRQAYELAHEQQTAGAVLHRLFHHAFGVSKRVRTESRIGEGKTSIPSLAADVICDAVGDLRDARILIVGAGEMARLSLEHLGEAGARNFVITTRTVTNAKALADAYGGRVAPFDGLDTELADADVVITATNCPMPIVTAERLGRARRGRPLLLIDLCVPRNVEPEVAGLPGTTLYDVDALGEAAAMTTLSRREQVKVCEGIVEEEVAAFETWLSTSKVAPLIEQMFDDVRALAAIEVRGFFRRFPNLSGPERDAVAELADRLVGKLMHPCVATVRREASFNSAAALADAFRDTRLSFSARLQASVAVCGKNTGASGINTGSSDVDPSSVRGRLSRGAGRVPDLTR